MYIIKEWLIYFFGYFLCEREREAKSDNICQRYDLSIAVCVRVGIESINMRYRYSTLKPIYRLSIESAFDVSLVYNCVCALVPLSLVIIIIASSLQSAFNIETRYIRYSCKRAQKKINKLFYQKNIWWRRKQ